MKILTILFKRFCNLSPHKKCFNSQFKRGMAIPLVFGLIVVAGILGTTIWMSSRIGNRRVNQIIERLQLANMAEAGIISGFAKLKLELIKGHSLEKIKISPIQLGLSLTEGSGTCETTVKLVKKNQFRITSQGNYQSKKRKFKNSKIMKIQAIAKIRTDLVQNRFSYPKYSKRYYCSLKIISREILNKKFQ